MNRMKMMILMMLEHDCDGKDIYTEYTQQDKMLGSGLV